MLREIRLILAEDRKLRALLMGDSGVVVDRHRVIGVEAARTPGLLVMTASALMMEALPEFVRREQQAGPGDAA